MTFSARLGVSFLLIRKECFKWHDGRTIRLCTLNDISEKINYERVIEKQVFYDNLTGLPNRLSLDKSIQGIIESDENSTVMLIDLDNFKNINDSYATIMVTDFLKR